MITYDSDPVRGLPIDVDDLDLVLRQCRCVMLDDMDHLLVRLLVCIVIADSIGILASHKAILPYKSINDSRFHHSDQY